MQTKHLLSLGTALFLGLLPPLRSEAVITSNGSFTYEIAGGTPVLKDDSLLLMNKNYRGIAGLPKRTVRINDRTTVVTAKTNVIDYRLTVVNREDGTADAVWDVTVAPHPEGQHLELCVALPAEFLARLPEKTQTRAYAVIPKDPGKTLNLDVLGGAVRLNAAGSSPNVTWFLDDLRKTPWSKALRLRTAPAYTPDAGCTFRAELHLTKAPSEDPVYACLDLAGAFNRTLRDDISGDGKGGWTDQGTNDLRELRPGRRTAQGIPFEFRDGAIVLRGKERPDFPDSSPEIPFPDQLRAERLCFVHTVAWFEKFRTTAFRYRVTYADGTQTDIPVLYNIHTADWWGAREPLDARFAWRGENNDTEVALHHMQWRNPKPAVPLKSLRVLSENNGVVPAVLAVTAVRDGILPAAQTDLLDRMFARRDPKNSAVVDTSAWFECPLPWKDTIEPGSALDASALNHRPAGRFGWLKTDPARGAFVFEKRPDEPVRFWGTNVALRGPFPPKEDAPGIAANFARQGVNHVRIHLYAVYPDCLLAPGGTLNPEALDKMEFFISELKKNGIYIYMDLNDGMLFNRLLDTPLPEKGSKYAALFNRDLVNACKRLATLLFTHQNPYTGLRMVDDPAVCLYEITNENSVTMNWGALENRLDPLYFNEIETLWKAWQTREGITPVRGIQGNFLEMGAQARRFAAELMRSHLEEMHAHLRQIGVKAPVCGTNITFTTGDLWAAQNMEYTNDHAYFDHPNVGSKPMTYNNNVMVTQKPHQLGIIPSFSRAKIAGKPLSASEWNFCYPNDRRCEGLPVMTAYAAFQNWDSLLFYCATGSFDSGSWKRFHGNPGILVHSQQTDPATWGLSQACAIAFRNAHIRPSRNLITLEYDPDDIWNNLNVAGRWPFLAAMARLETKLVPRRNPDAWPMTYDQNRSNDEHFNDAAKRLGLTSVTTRRVTGDTGEIVRYPMDGLFTVDTPKTKMATGALHTLHREGRALKNFTVTSPARFATVTLTALDEQPVETSKRLLLCVVANARNKDAVFNGHEIHNMGMKGPVLAEPVEADFSLTSRTPVTVYALDSLTGKRLRTLPATLADGAAHFSTTGAKTIYFELTR